MNTIEYSVILICYESARKARGRDLYASIPSIVPNVPFFNLHNLSPFHFDRVIHNIHNRIKMIVSKDDAERAEVLIDESKEFFEKAALEHRKVREIHEEQTRLNDQADALLKEAKKINQQIQALNRSVDSILEKAEQLRHQGEMKHNEAAEILGIPKKLPS